MHCKSCLLTIFTPAYNRAYCIGRLYESLCRQTCTDFEWIVVDDGSTDDIESKINGFTAEGKIKLSFIRQNNGGKHRAVNRGLDMAAGEYFYIVDSDDFLPDDAVEFIKQKTARLHENPLIAGIAGVDRTIEGKILSNFPDVDHIDATTADIRMKHRISGDMAEVVRTDVFRQFKFPEIPGERFCPEALVWNRMASAGYLFRYFPKVLKIIEYLPDGLTAAIIRIRANSPVASTMCYAEQCGMDMPFKQRIRSAINYWRFWLCRSKEKKAGLPICWSWLFPLGLILHLNDIRKL